MTTRPEVEREPSASRAKAWAATMAGVEHSGVRVAHGDSSASFEAGNVRTLGRREDQEDTHLAPGATRATGAGERSRPEEPDEYRTCFERDRDRILHSASFRRLAGKTQVFVFPHDHQRTRLTHAIEVAQVARAIAEALRLNVALVEAIAFGHDCGHGPGGHPSEDAFSPYLPGGYDHAVFGADVVLEPLNLTTEVLDGIRNHSWSRPAPRTPEGEVVSWADRIAYVCHDFEDAVSAGVVHPDELPGLVQQRCGKTRGQQLGTFITALVESSARSGQICMDPETADALAAFRQFNYNRIYLRPDSSAQAEAVVEVLRALVDHFAEAPLEIPDVNLEPATDDARVLEAVRYVAGMTDRYAFDLARLRLGYPASKLPQGIDLGRPSALSAPSA